MKETIVNNEAIESVHIPRNYFNRSKKRLMSMEMGKIYPTYCSLLVPNDLVEIKPEVVVREMPTRKPTFSDKKLITRYFVVACRNLDKNFYRFLTGFKEYSTRTPYEEPLKVWNPSSAEITRPGELWDCLEYPTDCIPDEDSLPLAFWKDAYNYIYDLYFRNETVEESILVDGEPGTSDNEKLLTVNKDRDFFTTALPFQQLGDPLALPITGNTTANWTEQYKGVMEDSRAVTKLRNSSFPHKTLDLVAGTKTKVVNDYYWKINLGEGAPADGKLYLDNSIQTPINRDKFLEYMNNNTVDMTNISSVFISELRFAFAMQLFQEMQARGGIRDNEFLLMHYGTAPTDETLGRPRYLGGLTINILTEEILQTSQTTNTEPLGQIAGHGLAVGEGSKIRYHAKEFCVLLGLSYIKTDNLYGNLGMPKEFSLKTLYDFPLPIFSHLSEQPVFKREVLCASSKKIKKDYSILETDDKAKEYNAEIFGYRPVYDWMRQTNDTVHGLFKLQQFYKDANTIEKVYNLYQWSEAFFYSIKEGERPALNKDFMKATYDNRNYSIVDNTINRSQFLVWVRNEAHYWRPLSKLGTPGRVDHIL